MSALSSGLRLFWGSRYFTGVRQDDLSLAKCMGAAACVFSNVEHSFHGMVSEPLPATFLVVILHASIRNGTSASIPSHKTRLARSSKSLFSASYPDPYIASLPPGVPPDHTPTPRALNPEPWP